MKKYKIGKRIIKADSIVEAVKISRMLDSPKTRVKSRDNEIDELTQEEQQAVEDYREAIKNTSNPKLLEIYSHILKEETEHLEELAQARELTDAKSTYNDFTYERHKSGVWFIEHKSGERWAYPASWTEKRVKEELDREGQFDDSCGKMKYSTAKSDKRLRAL